MKELVACSVGNVDVSKIPKEIKILPLGYVHSEKGNFNVDDESAELIINKFKERKLDLVIDYEHQTLGGQQAPAGGWIKDLYKGEDAIIAKVEWTKKAEEYLKNKEYKYLSPVVLVRKRDNKATTIHSVALTNTPAVDGMFAIVNSNTVDIENLSEYKEEAEMELKEIAKLLGLPETATEDEIKEALSAAKTVKEGSKKEEPGGEKKEEPKKEGTQEDEKVVANSTILGLLGCGADSTTEDVAASIMALKVGDANTQAELKALKAEMKEKGAEELVMKALKDGKITAAQKEWAKEYALSDSKGFESFLEKAPKVVPTEKLELKDAPESGTEVDMAILKNCGISEEDVKKYYKK